MNKTFRYMRKHWRFTLINVLGLAFGFTCALLIVLHVLKEHSYNSSIPNHERAFYLLQRSPDSQLGNTTISYALTPLLTKHFPEIEYSARTENFSQFKNCIISYQPSHKNDILSFNESSFHLADKDLFKILPYTFIEGSADNALTEPNSIVLSKATAAKYFGDSPALGKSLVLNNEQTFNVSGVVDFPDYVTFTFSMLAPITSVRSEDQLSGWNSNGQPFFMLHKNINTKEFNKKLEHFYNEFKPTEIRNRENITLSLLPITERRLHYNKNPLYLLMFIGAMILLVSILNYTNMSTSLVETRRSEIAVKKISGASKESVGWRFMVETFFIGFNAIVLGGIMTIVGAPIFRNIVGSDILPYLENNMGIFIMGSIIIWILTSILAGFYPSIILSGVKPLNLFHKDKKSGTGIKSKDVIITSQFTISIILLVLTLMINRQYRYMKNIPLGFESKMVMQVPFNDKLKNSFSNLKDELKKIPEIKDVCAASSMPVGIPNHSGVSWIDDEGIKHDESFGFAIVSDGYTQTFGMNMVLGNEFEYDRPEGLKGVIINETAARNLGYDNPIGKPLKFWGRENNVIGVVKDFQNNFLFNTIKPMIISAHPKNQGFTKYLFVSFIPGGDIENTIVSVQSTFKEIAPDFPFEYTFTNAQIHSYIEEIKEINKSFNFASIVSILLATIGLVALTMRATQARIKEIGVRKVNGAKRIEIIRLLNKKLLRNVLLAFLLATPVAWMIINSLLQGIGNRTNIAWWVFAVSGLLTTAIALFTVSLQSWKAASRNPVEALRYE